MGNDVLWLVSKTKLSDEYESMAEYDPERESIHVHAIQTTTDGLMASTYRRQKLRASL